MRFLAISIQTSPAPAEQMKRDMTGEVAYAKELFERGVLLEGYMDAAFVTAYLFLEGTSQAETQDTLAKFPLVQAGFLQFTVIPLVGLPAIAQSLHAHNLALPTWWPQES